MFHITYIDIFTEAYSCSCPKSVAFLAHWPMIKYVQEVCYLCDRQYNEQHFCY